MSNSKGKNLKRATTIGLVIVAVLAGVILVSQKFQSPSNKLSKLTSYPFGDLTIQTELSKDFAQSLFSFLSTTTKENILPKELILNLSQKGKDAQGDTFSANWNKDGKYMSVLFGLTPDNKHVNYQRIWMLSSNEPLTEQTANELLSEIFQDSFLSDIGVASCKAISQTENETITECGRMKTVATGDLMGTTVRSPVNLPPPPGATPPPNFTPPVVTVVSACFVPKEVTALYTWSSCI